jgi:AraC-like DNA-binding protein
LAIRAVRAHGGDYLRKPVDLRELSAVLGRLAGAGTTDPIARARELQEERCEKPLRLTTLSGQLGLSERHLRQRFGMTLTACRSAVRQ